MTGRATGDQMRDDDEGAMSGVGCDGVRRVPDDEMSGDEDGDGR